VWVEAEAEDGGGVQFMELERVFYCHERIADCRLPIANYIDRVRFLPVPASPWRRRQ